MARLSEDAATGASTSSRFSLLKEADEMEAAVCDIRRSSSWIQRIIDKLKDVDDCNPHSQSTAALLTSHRESIESQRSCDMVSQVYLASRSTEESSDTIQSHKRQHSTAQMLEVVQGRVEEPLYPVELEVQPHDLRAGAVNRFRRIKLLHVAAFGLIQVAIIAFCVTLRLALADKAGTMLVWHPMLMGAVLALLTEATVIAQNMPWAVSCSVRRVGHKAYNIAQWLAAAVCMASILACIRGYSEARLLHGLGPAHRRVGSIALLVLAAQLGFDVGATCCAGKLGVSLKPKHRRNVSRALGYLALVLMWASAWLGVHSQWLGDRDVDRGSMLVSEWIWFWVFLVLIVGILAPVDISKLVF